MKFILLLALFGTVFADTDRGLVQDAFQYGLKAIAPYLNEHKSNFDSTLNEIKAKLEEMLHNGITSIAKTLPYGQEIAKNVAKSAEEFQNFVKTMGQAPEKAVKDMNAKFEEIKTAIDQFEAKPANEFAAKILNVLGPVINMGKSFLKAKVDEIQFHSNDAINSLSPEWMNAIQATANQATKVSDALTQEMEKMTASGQENLNKLEAAAKNNINELENIAQGAANKVLA